MDEGLWTETKRMRGCLIEVLGQDEQIAKRLSHHPLKNLQRGTGEISRRAFAPHCTRCCIRDGPRAGRGAFSCFDFGGSKSGEILAGALHGDVGGEDGEPDE